MKKLISIILTVAFILLATIAIADVDISGLSFEELVALKEKINLAIWNSKEWQEVTVPQGEWVVGEDIPAGKWLVKCANVSRSNYMMQKCDIEWGFLNANGYIDTYISKGGNDLNLYNPNHKDYDKGEVTEVIADLKEGMIVRIKELYAPAVFTPYSGKPDLGFK